MAQPGTQGISVLIAAMYHDDHSPRLSKIKPLLEQD
jgi:hypothetical protein